MERYSISNSQFVAEAKFRKNPEEYSLYIGKKDQEKLLEMLTVTKVEENLLKRLRKKAELYGTDSVDSASPRDKINVDLVVRIYREWLIPLTKQVEVEYLLQRLS